MSQEHPRPRGRPPSAEARRKALAAAHEILMTEGFGRVTVEAVATRSGVGKPTIYRNWANASELAMAALMEGQSNTATGEGDFRSALRRQLRDIVQTFATTRGRQIGLALAAADPDSEMTRAFRNRVVLSGRETGRNLLAQATARGEFGQVPDIEVVLDMIYAPIFYRLLLGHRPLDMSFAESLADSAVALLIHRQASSDTPAGHGR